MHEYNANDYQNVIRRLFKVNGFFASNTMVKCPYHKDKTPSLSIHNLTGQWQCFSCKRKGYIGSLVQDMTGKTMDRFLDKGVDESEFNNFFSAPTHKQYVEEPVSIEDIENKVNLDIRGVLIPWRQSPEAVEYVKNRYIPEHLADKYGFLYSEDSVINRMPFIKRLCIPIYNKEGKLLNMEGRDVTFTQKRKCIYPFDSVKPLYNWYNLDTTKPIFLFEGLIKMFVAQSDEYFHNSTAIFGSNFSEYQLEFIKSFPEVIYVSDNDKAGKTSVSVLKEHYTGILRNLRIVNPNIKDTDEIPKKTGMSVKEFREQGGFSFEVAF